MKVVHAFVLFWYFDFASVIAAIYFGAKGMPDHARVSMVIGTVFMGAALITLFFKDKE